MKTTTTPKTILVILVLCFFALQSFAQDMSGTLMTIVGKNYSYSDQMWIFTEPTCTRGFDNGWDGYKMFGGSSNPQLFAMEEAGNFQVDAVPNINNTYIAFRAGVDTTYRITFQHQYLSMFYQQLYFVDSIANITVDIYASGCTYTFTATNRTEIIKRFKLIAIANPAPVVEPDPVVVVEPTPVVIPPAPVTEPAPVVPTPIVEPTPVPDPTPVVTPADPTPTTPPVVDNSKDKKDKKDNKEAKDKVKKMKIYNTGKTIYIENPGKKGKIKVCHAITGRVLKNMDINADGTTTINTDLPGGTYIVNGVTPTEDVSTTVIVR